MIDNDIMKDVRCCADGYCKGCSLQGKPNCRYTLLSFAWDTMYNQKAEIDMWKEEANHYQNLWCKAEADEQEARAEAIKEFAERLKIDFGHGVLGMSSVGAIIDNLVKVMTEE